MMTIKDFELELNLFDAEICSGFDILVNSIIQTSILGYMDMLNSKLTNPLKSFVIRGSTPYFNDGDECTHISEHALPHVAKNSNGNIYLNDLIDYYEEYYKLIFENWGIDFVEYPESHFLSNAISDGTIPEIRAYVNHDEYEMITKTIESIENMLEKILKTNFLVVYNVNKEEKIKVSKYNPEY